MGSARAVPQHSRDQVGAVLGAALGTMLGTMLGPVLGPGVQDAQTRPRACRLWWGLQTRAQMTVKDPRGRKVLSEL